MIGDGKFVCGGGDSTATRHGTGTGATRGSRGREVHQTKLAVVDACDTFGWFVCGGGGAGCRGRGRGVRSEQMVECECGEGHDVIGRQKTKTEGAAPGNTFLMTWPCGRTKISAHRAGNRKIEFCFLFYILLHGPVEYINLEDRSGTKGSKLAVGRS